MLENMQWVEEVSKWIFPAIGYGIRKFCNADTYRISAIIYEPLSRFQGTTFYSRDFYCRVRKFDSSAYFDIHVHDFKNIKKILVNFSYDTLLGPGYIVSYLRLE